MGEETDTSWMEGCESGWETDMAETAFAKSPTERIRFWMPVKSEKVITFLDEVPAFACWEHGFKIDGDFRHYATCLGHLKVDGKPMECVACVAADSKASVVSKYKIVPFSIIDGTEFILKNGKDKGKKRKNVKRLFIAKNKVWEKLARRAATLKKEGKSLRGAQFTVFRSSDDKSPSTGDDFEYIGHVDLATFEDSKVFDYAKLFKPDLELVARYMAQILRVSGSSAMTEGVERTADEVFGKD